MTKDLNSDLHEKAPMFVKLEKYNEVLGTISELREFVQSLKYVFDIAEEAEAIRTDAIRVVRASLNKLEKSIHQVDAGLVKPSGWKSDKHLGSTKISIERLQSQLARLRKDVEYFGSEKTEAA